jgi:hypothetical protein
MIMSNSYKNHSEEIFKMLGIKPMKRFRIKPLIKDEQKEYDGILFYFTSNLICYSDDGFEDCKNYTILPKLLSGQLKIVKELFTKNINLTKEEQTVIDYCKLCGYKYLTKDKNGEVWAYKEKPVKRGEMWIEPKYDDITEIEYNLSFLSWDDEEPWVIE